MDLCKVCDKPLPTGKRKFCSGKCYRIEKKARNNRKNPETTCKRCGGKCPNYDNQFCSFTCRSKHQQILSYRKKIIDYKLFGKTLGFTTAKRYIWNKHKGKCSLCGWNKINPKTGKTPLEIDHIDGNWTNNCLDNLRLLCPNCHSLTDTYRALNKRLVDRRVVGQRKKWD